MPNCAVPGCKSNSRNQQSYTERRHFFQFPKDDELKKEWLKYCRSNISLKSGRICSLHFLPSDLKPLTFVQKYMPKESVYRFLKEGSVPSVNLPSKDPPPGYIISIATEHLSEEEKPLCSIRGCAKKLSFLKSIHFFNFPKGDVCKEWMKYCDESCDVETALVCSSHFLPSAFEDRWKKQALPDFALRRLLKETAVPTVNLPSDPVIITKITMPSCSIRGCKRDDTNISLFSIPNTLKGREWLKYCKPEVNINTAKVCSRHFVPSDIEEISSVQQQLPNTKVCHRLKDIAAPTLNLPETDAIMEKNTSIKKAAGNQPSIIDLTKIEANQSTILQSALNNNQKVQVINAQEPVTLVILNNNQGVQVHNANTTPQKTPCQEQQMMLHASREADSLRKENKELRAKMKEHEAELKKLRVIIQKSDTLLQKITKMYGIQERKVLKAEKMGEKYKQALENVFTPGQFKILTSSLGQQRTHWTAEDISPAIILQSISPQAYDFVRNTMKIPLPGYNTLKQWIRANNTTNSDKHFRLNKAQSCSVKEDHEYTGRRRKKTAVFNKVSFVDPSTEENSEENQPQTTDTTEDPLYFSPEQMEAEIKNIFGAEYQRTKDDNTGESKKLRNSKLLVEKKKPFSRNKVLYRQPVYKRKRKLTTVTEKPPEIAKELVTEPSNFVNIANETVSNQTKFIKIAPKVERIVETLPQSLSMPALGFDEVVYSAENSTKNTNETLQSEGVVSENILPQINAECENETLQCEGVVSENILPQIDAESDKGESLLESSKNDHSYCEPRRKKQKFFVKVEPSTNVSGYLLDVTSLFSPINDAENNTC